MSDLVFDDLEPRYESVSIGRRAFILKEATGGVVCKWKNFMMKSTKMGPGGRPSGLGDVADADPYLVSLCLFEVFDKDGKKIERPVSLETIKGWPARVQNALFEKVKQISDLDTKEEEPTIDLVEQKLMEAQEALDRLREDLSTRKSSLNGAKHDDSTAEGRAKNEPSSTTVGSR